LNPADASAGFFFFIQIARILVAKPVTTFAEYA